MRIYAAKTIKKIDNLCSKDNKENWEFMQQRQWRKLRIYAAKTIKKIENLCSTDNLENWKSDIFVKKKDVNTACC